MLFVKRVKPYKGNTNYVKSVDGEVSSIGFPARKGNLSLDITCTILEAEKYDDETDNVIFYLKDNIKQGFES